MELQKFESILEQALKDIPERFRALLDNITIEVEPEKIARGGDGGLILGHYIGVPLPQRGPAYRNVLPDRIILYRRAIEQWPVEEVPELIRNVLQHEIGHYFGMSEEELSRYKKA